MGVQVLRRAGVLQSQAAAGGDPIAGLSPYVWLDPEPLALANNDPVSSYTDASGNSRHATQATSALRPVFKTNVQNGLPALLFGVDDALATAGFGVTLAQPLTVSIVCNIVGSGAGSGRWLFDGIDATNRAAVFKNTDTTINPYAGSIGGFAQAEPTGWHIWTTVFDGASSVIYKDGVSVGAASWGTNGLAGLTVGNRYSQVDGDGLDGYMGDALLFNRALDSTDRGVLHGALGSKWAISV